MIDPELNEEVLNFVTDTKALTKMQINDVEVENKVKAYLEKIAASVRKWIIYSYMNFNIY